MNGALAKKVRKSTKRHWGEYLKDLMSMPFWGRVKTAWFIVFGDKKEIG